MTVEEGKWGSDYLLQTLEGGSERIAGYYYKEGSERAFQRVLI